MTQVTPTPVHPAAEADEVGRRAAPPTPSRGGWSIGIFVLMLAIVAAVAIVGIGGTATRSRSAGGDAATEASVSPDQCRDELRTVSVAFEAYYAENGHAAESLDVLVGQFLREMPARWTFTPSNPGMLTGVGGCAYVGTVKMSGDL